MKGHERIMDKKQNTKVINSEKINIADLKREVLRSFEENPADPGSVAEEGMKSSEKADENMDAREPVEQERKVSLDELSDEEFLELYGDGQENEEDGETEEDGEEKSSRKEKKAARPKRKWVNPIRIFRDKITDESIDDDTAKLMVNIIGIVGGLAFILVVVLATVFIYSQYSSFSSQYEKAVEYENAGNIANAAGCYEKAIDAARTRGDRIRGRLALANLYLDQHSDTNAAFYFEQVVDIDHGNREAIEKLLTLYESNNDMQSILDLAEKASGEGTDALFEDYLLNQPVFNYKSGTYDEPLTIEITAGEAERIYYTTDDSEATEASILYAGPIQLDQGKTVFHAMAVNANGLMSQNIVVNYDIISEAPPAPLISPKSGTYRELTNIEVEIPDGCRAYYTLDDTVPTNQSPEYTGSLTLPIGNHVLSMVFINQNGISSEVSRKVYDFIFSAPITKTEAIDIVRNGLVASGELLDASGEAADPANGTAEFYCDEVVTVNDEDFYRVNKRYTNGGFSSYGVEINTGAVFSLLDDGGKYTLAGF